jgi:hypothetical protein
MGIQLTPRPPNVEFTSLIVFLVGVSLGIAFGGLLATIVMLVNGFFSPWGFAGLLLPFQIAGMVIIGVTGGLYGRARRGTYSLSHSGETAVLGAFLTLIYDVITNFGVAAGQVGTPMLPAFTSAIIFGAPFSAVHVVSNFWVFLAAFYPLIRALQKLSGGERVWRENASLM